MAKAFPGREKWEIAGIPAGRITTEEDKGRKQRAVARTRIASRRGSRIEINPRQNETPERGAFRAGTRVTGITSYGNHRRSIRVFLSARLGHPVVPFTRQRWRNRDKTSAHSLSRISARLWDDSWAGLTRPSLWPRFRRGLASQRRSSSSSLRSRGALSSCALCTYVRARSRSPGPLIPTDNVVRDLCCPRFRSSILASRKRVASNSPR